MELRVAKIRHRMTEFGEQVLRQIFNERVEIFDTYAEIRTKSTTLCSADADELFWVWLEFVKNIGAS